MKSKTASPHQQLQESISLETPKKRILPPVNVFDKHDEFVETPSKSKRRSAKKSQRRRNTIDSDEEEKIDRKTEENIQQAAMKNNLSEDTVKKILKKVVGNDHVLAIVKLKEDEMERNCQSEQFTDIDEDECEHAPKITRSKAKTLNKKILPITSPMEPSEASILIQQELGSDDEDEEYEPGNEDVHSDDDPNSSISDMDSQPRTPKTPYTADEDTPTKYTNDGLFKIPRDRTDSSTSQNEPDYIIAKRTRSKVSLTTTSIETIESTFQPPDISPDMYDRDNEMDSDWKEFLNILTKPINNVVEDDDETDPEYIVADQIPIDKEELRAVNISKKELNDLVDELFSNLSEVDFDEINEYDNIPQLFRSKQKARAETNNDTNKTVEQFSQDNPSFQPSQVSTPISSRQNKSLQNISTTETIEDNSVASMLSSSMLSNQSSITNSDPQTPFVVPVNVVNPLRGASLVNGVIQIPQFQQILIQIPTIDILKMQAQNQSNLNIANTGVVTRSAKMNENAYHNASESLQMESSIHHFNRRQKSGSIYRNTRYQYHLFEHLKTDLPIDVVFDEGLEGFTPTQRDILNQQLRMHVQFATQNFLQVYGHPGNNLWQHAIKFKSFVTELDEVTSGSHVHIENLQPALNLMNKWEEDLSTASTENTEYLDFLLGESNKSQHAIKTRSSYVPKFNKRMMNVVVESTVFKYPHLLPKIPFRMDFIEKPTLSTFIPAEDFLIAFFLENIYKECLDEKIRNKCRRTKVSLERVCHKICIKMCPFRLCAGKQAMYKYVSRRKSQYEPYNPIQYYFEHKRAPPFNHQLINLDNIVAPKELPLTDLPYAWAEHLKQRRATEHDKIIQQAQIGISKPIQKVSPRIRSHTADNIEDSDNLYYPSERNTSISLSSSPKPPAKPIFAVRPINSNDTSVPIQYEIIEINSAAQLAELSEASNVVTSSHAEVNPKIKIKSRRKSKIPSNISRCVGSKKRKQAKSKRKSKLPKSQIKTYFTEFNPNKSREDEINVTNSEAVETKSFANHNRFYSTSRKIVKKYLRIKQRSGVKRLLVQKLCRIVQNYKSEHYAFQCEFASKKHLLDLSNSIQTLNIYVSLIVYNLKMAAAIKRSPKESGDDLNRRLKCSDDAIVEQSEIYSMLSSTVTSVVTKRHPKAQRTDNTRLMLIPEAKEDINEKDMVYAQNFMDKVEETYLAENNPHKLTELQDILQKFSQSTDNVPDLYNKIEQLFLPEHPELAELFLTFLLPGHAAQVGKFIEHFMLTNMNTFINKLNLFFNKQPAQIRKIMTCLRELSNEDDLKLEQIKTKIFPLLKGNPMLIEWFKQCFPSETAYECPAEEYESLSFHKAENSHPNDDENDVYENIPQTEILPDPVENPCHIRYLNGRVYYGSRILLPAKLSFLVVTAKDQNTINEVARNKSGNLKHRDTVGETETDYRCVHSIKQYGDNKMKECQKTQLETFDVAAGDDVDIERVADEHNCSDTADDADILQSPEACIQIDEKSGTGDSSECLYNTCDDLSLKAHGIRLNPTVHQSTVIKSEDLLCLLEPIDDVSDKFADESLKNSSKKYAARAQRKSPNSKKSAKRSPTNIRKLSATLLSSDDSQAIQTAKRLKRLIESGEMDEQVSQPKKSKPSKCPKSTDGSGNRKKKQSQNEEVGIGAEKFDSISTPSVSETSLLSTETCIWSRDEDKLVLEQIKMGFTNEEDLVKILHEEKLPNRSFSEIYDRFRFLMDVIANL